MKGEVLSKYVSLLEKVKTGEKPVVFVNACTHGHEKVGYKVIETLKNIKLSRGTLITNVANERAFEMDIPFVEMDLNRIFPGKKNGSYEERIAHALNPVVKAVDVCIDIHSTNTMSVGDGSALIVTKLDGPTIDIIDCIKPPRVFLMNVTQGSALISGAKIGIGFEYGKDDEQLTHDYTVRDILKVLLSLGMINDFPKSDCWSQNTRYYDVFATLPKKGLEVKIDIKNFVPVSKGSLLGISDGKDYLAPFDFIPILFGPNRYKDIYGFLGREIFVDKKFGVSL